MSFLPLKAQFGYIFDVLHFLNVICFPIFEHFCGNKQKLQLELQQSKPGQLELPKLRKIVKEEAEPEKKKEDDKKEKTKKVVKKKRESDYELPEIPDYERPELEKYEKSDFDPTRRVSWGTRIKERSRPPHAPLQLQLETKIDV